MAARKKTIGGTITKQSHASDGVTKANGLDAA
jgi:hypothetical protein